MAKTVYWHQDLDGGGRVDVEEKQVDTGNSGYVDQKWEGHDESGKSNGKGRLITNDDGSWSLNNENYGSDGSKVVTSAAGDAQGGERHTTSYDASGGVAGQEDSVTIINSDGSSSTTTQSTDAQGTSTFTSVVQDSDGTVHTHTMVIDSNGKVVSDERSDPGQPPPDPPPSNGGGGDDEGDHGEEQGAAASGDEEGDGVGEGRGPVIGSPGGPRFPGEILGKILHDLGVSRGGGGTDEWNDGNGPDVTAEQANRIIAAAHHASSRGGSDDQHGTDGAGAGRPDIVIAVPTGAIEDWNDHPRPETIQRFTQWLLANASALNASTQALQDMSGVLSSRAAPP
jgi:hypothetical protein